MSQRMDAPGSYRWGTYKQHISRKEIENMKKNMKKVPVIQLKTEIYHNKEIHEAEKILENISSLKTETIASDKQSPNKNTWYRTKIISLRKQFISLF